MATMRGEAITASRVEEVTSRGRGGVGERSKRSRAPLEFMTVTTGNPRASARRLIPVLFVGFYGAIMRKSARAIEKVCLSVHKNVFGT